MKSHFSSLTFHPLKVTLVQVWINPTGCLSGLSPVHIGQKSWQTAFISGGVTLLAGWVLVIIF